MKKDDIISAIGYLAADLKNERDNETIRESWTEIAEAIGLDHTEITDDEIETLREVAA